MEIYFNSSDSTLKQIEKIQTACLRICAGAMRSTHINCLQVHCNEMPLKLKFEQLCLNFRTYLGTFANHPSSSVIQDSWQERFPDNFGFCSFNMRTKGFFHKPNMNLNTIVLPDIPIWLIDKPVIDLNIVFLCRKNDNTNWNDRRLRRVFLCFYSAIFQLTSAKFQTFAYNSRTVGTSYMKF